MELTNLDLAAMLADAPLLVVVFLFFVRPWAKRVERELRTMRRAMERAGIDVPDVDDDDDDPTPALGTALQRQVKPRGDEPSGVH